MSQANRQAAEPSSAFATRVHGEAPPAYNIDARSQAVPYSSNPSPFHVINGVAYRRDGALSLEYLIRVLASAGVPEPTAGRRDS